MDIWIKSARITDPTSTWNGKVVDLLVRGGEIEKIGKGIFGKQKSDAKIKVYESKNLHISPGWIDMRARFCDPGHEYKEDLSSGLQAAMHGGFTAVVVMPSTNPPIDSKADIDYLLGRARNSIVDVFPVGTLSKGMQGKELSEMYDMHCSGAVAFGDDKTPVNNARLLVKALRYVKSFDGLIMSFCNEPQLSNGGQINEGEISAMLGLKGIPNLAEVAQLSRDIALATYTSSKLHVGPISTKESVEVIRAAKKQGLSISAEVSASHLSFSEKCLEEFDPAYKLFPPLRTKDDITALKKGLRDGTIDAICSDHTPENDENKKLEFNRASFGMIGLQTCFALVNESLKETLTLDQLIDKMAIQPRKIMNLPIPSIHENEKANLTLFDPTRPWTLTPEKIKSKSKNTPLLGQQLLGKSLGIYNKSKFKATE